MKISKIAIVSTLGLYGWTAKGYVVNTTPAATKSLSESVGQKVLRPDLMKSENKDILKGAFDVEIDAHSGAARLLSGRFLELSVPRTEVEKDIFIQNAQRFIVDNFELFGVRSQDLKVVDGSTLIDGELQFVQFEVFRNGFSIEDATIGLRFKRGVLVQIVNRSFAEAAISDDIAGSVSQIPLSIRSGAANLKSLNQKFRVIESASGYALQKVQTYRFETNGEPYRAQIGKNGVYEIVSERHYEVTGNATADVYPRSYRDQLKKDGLQGLLIQESANSTKPSSYSDVNGKFVLSSGQPAVSTLSGRKVDVQSIKPVSLGIVTSGREGVTDLHVRASQSSGNPDDGVVAQAMAFYHINKVIAYATRFIYPRLFDLTQNLQVNAYASCNAYFDGKSMVFFSAGDGCGNTALIADVIYHEWGHALDSAIGGINDSSFSEGIGDIVSMIMTGDHKLGVGFKLNGDVIRDLAGDYRHPMPEGTDPHTEGLIIGSTFWDLAQEFNRIFPKEQARDELASRFFKVLYTAKNFTDVYSALLVIDDDDTNLANGTPNFCAINRSFSRHGLAALDANCARFSFDQALIQEIRGNANGVAEPGEKIAFSTNLFNAGIDGIDAQGKIRSLTVPGITMAGGAFAWQDLAPGTSGRASGQTTLELGSAVPCGTILPVVVDATTANFKASRKFEIPVGAEFGAETFSAAAVPVEIPDNGQVIVPIEVRPAGWPASSLVKKARISIRAAHSRISDIALYLVAPGGVETFVYRSAGTAKDMLAEIDISSLVSKGKVAGTWKLIVKDRAERDAGSLVSASLSIVPDVRKCSR